jgi:hypothetical protein
MHVLPFGQDDALRPSTITATGSFLNNILDFQGVFKRWGVRDSEVDRWGAGIEQEVERSAPCSMPSSAARSFLGERCPVSCTGK